MNWITKVARPKLAKWFQPGNNKEGESLWTKCPTSGELVFYRDIEENNFVIPNSGYHLPISNAQRCAIFFDNGEYEVHEIPSRMDDPLNFRDKIKYVDRLRLARGKTGQQDAITVATGKLRGQEVVIFCQDPSFMAGSLSSAGGDAIVYAMTLAAEQKLPLIAFCASGGARMQEGIYSLMQMPRTIAALSKLKEKNIPYVVVLCNPTTGGVSASFAMLGDVHIAEPGALICFAGPRVIESTIKEKLPAGFQRAEFLYERGMIDMIVDRNNQRSLIARLLGIFMHKRAEIS